MDFKVWILTKYKTNYYFISFTSFIDNDSAYILYLNHYLLHIIRIYFYKVRFTMKSKANNLSKSFEYNIEDFYRITLPGLKSRVRIPRPLL